jgi:hypothetical protein
VLLLLLATTTWNVGVVVVVVVRGAIWMMMMINGSDNILIVVKRILKMFGCWLGRENPAQSENRDNNKPSLFAWGPEFYLWKKNVKIWPLVSSRLSRRSLSVH